LERENYFSRGGLIIEQADFRCPVCNGTTEKVYETKRNVFLRCSQGHPAANRKGDARIDQAVFMVNKKTLAAEAV
jgi:hypothetical protein